jgi:hypothetical protein
MAKNSLSQRSNHKIQKNSGPSQTRSLGKSCFRVAAVPEHVLLGRSDFLENFPSSRGMQRQDMR